MCFTLINSRSHQKIYIFASFVLLVMRLCLVTGSFRCKWPYLESWHGMMGIFVTYCRSPFSGRSSFGAGRFRRENETNRFSVTNNNFPEHGKCMKAWILFNSLWSKTWDSKQHTLPNCLFLNRKKEKKKKKTKKEGSHLGLWSLTKDFSHIDQKKKITYLFSSSEGRMIWTFYWGRVC